jgi:hypothetical protein
LVDLISQKSENGYQFSHDFDEHFGHRGGGFLDIGIYRDSFDKALDAFKNVD